MKRATSKLKWGLLALAVVASVASATIIQGEYGFNSGNYIAAQVDSGGKLLFALPSGASTDTKQDTGNTSLASIDSKTPSLVSGNVPISGAVSITGSVTTVSDAYVYKNITGNATTVVKSGAGTLKGIVFNTPGTLSSMVLYDNTSGSGTKIGTINTTLGQNSLSYEVAFTTGLTIVTSGTLAADATVSYK